MSKLAQTPNNILTATADPATPTIRAGDVYWNSSTAKLRVYNGSTWSDVNPQVGGSYTVSATAPGSPVAGDRWLETDLGIEYTYFNDGTSVQWVETSGGLVGASGSVGASGQALSNGLYDPGAGTTTIANGRYSVMVKKLILTTTERLSLVGTARLSIVGVD